MITAIGWITIFLVGGYAFAGASAMIAMHLTRGQELGALVWGGIVFKAAIVVWIGLFLWFAPITISIG